MPGEPYLLRDCCGLFSASLTLLLLLYGQVMVSQVLNVTGLSLLLYTLCTFFAIASHIRSMISDPGNVPIFLNFSNEYYERGAHKCLGCQNVKPRQAHHCSVCSCCVMFMDHHCPWVNNCVGILNQKYFVLFLVYTFLCSVQISYHVTNLFFSHAHLSGWTLGLSVSVAVASAVFGLFVVVMFVDQISAIWERHISKYEALIMVFGETVSYRWLLPLAPTRELLLFYSSEVRNFLPTKEELENLVKEQPDVTNTNAGTSESESYDREEEPPNNSRSEFDVLTYFTGLYRRLRTGR